jgi:hypothetical protein
LNAITSKPHYVSDTEPYLGILGNELVLETTSGISLLSTKKVVRLIKGGSLADAFLLLIQHDDSLKGISDKESDESADGISFCKICSRELKSRERLKEYFVTL